jgi:hydrogenase expression/formation protein HypD
MKYIREFRNGDVAALWAKKITASVDPNKHYKLMEFCGGHTHAIHRYGLPSLLPDNIEMIHGPGCPVCVLPIARVDNAIALAHLPQVILCSYGDMLRVPGDKQESLLKAKARGADVRMIYSVQDALAIARANPKKQIIFFAIGFETTTPPTAVAILTAKREGLKNFFVFCNHVLTPVAMRAILGDADQAESVLLDGFIGPAHVSVVIGSDPYQAIAKTYKKPIVVSGFEPLDLMQSIDRLVTLVNQKSHAIDNQFTRAVTPQGNQKAQALVEKVLTLRDKFEWRGLGWIPKSALKIRDDYAAFDAEKQFDVPASSAKEHRQCQCGVILRGEAKPFDCKLFARVCSPENPLGACMVSAEGACAAYYAYGRLSDEQNSEC